MDIIQLLPDSVANQIAAGEVIQRPASVIKELVENAVDAGASHITVSVEDAGKTLIQVIDDGKGMSETDARLAFERHATSKIRKADDLFALTTMGFRGEALASIAAVAHVELRTRTADNEIGTQINIEGCKVIDQQVVSCPVGSNFIVRSLFFNVPARRKFLKKDQTELNNIMQEMERMMLVNCDKSFTITSNGQTLYNIVSSNLLQRIVAVFGKKMHETLLPVEVETSECRITGYVGKPEAARKKGVHQFFFVNGRYMRHPYFHRAVVEAFEKIVPSETQVPYFLYFDLAPSSIDVNIHPTKTEIKFENEYEIWHILHAALRETLAKYNIMPTIDFEQDGTECVPAFVYDIEAANRFTETSDSLFDPSYNPFSNRSKSLHDNSESPAYFEKSEHFEEQVPEQQYVFDVPVQQKLDFDVKLQQPESERSVEHYQYKGKYIMTSVKSGLMLVHQNRAHIRVLYDEYMKILQGRAALSQQLLFPEIVTFSTADTAFLQTIQGQLEAVGFEIVSLGAGSFSVNAVPAGLENSDISALLNQIVDSIREHTSNAADDINSLMALSLARRQAILTGEVLDNAAMDSLLNKLFASSMPNFTPDGKPILKVVEQERIEALFA